MSKFTRMQVVAMSMACYTVFWFGFGFVIGELTRNTVSGLLMIAPFYAGIQWVIVAIYDTIREKGNKHE